MKDIILKLNKIYKEELLRKSKNKLLTYNTGEKKHLKQLAFHMCPKRNRWVFGGNRSGKTECGAVEVIYLTRGNHPYKKINKDMEGWVVSLSSQVQRDVAQKKILHYLNPDWIEEIVMQSGRKDYPESGIIDYIKIKNELGGFSKIGFRNCDQGREKFQGASLDFVWFDEEPPKEIYLECKMRVFDRQGETFGTMTPLKGLSWVYHEIYLNCHSDPEVWYEQMQWEDNPFLSPVEIKNIESTLSVDEIESRKYGRFMGCEGLVYKEFDQNVHVIQPFNVPKEWYDNISIDPGLNNPLSAHWYAVDYDGNVYVIAEHYAKGKDIDYHTDKIKNICESLNWKKNYDGRYSALIDSAANQRTLANTKSVAELFYDRGINVNTKVNKDLFSGISRVKSYLKSADNKTKLFIFENCVNMIREFKSYFWGQGDNPIKKDDHSMDELRYYIMSKPQNEEVLKERSLYQKHKDRKVKNINIKVFY